MNKKGQSLVLFVIIIPILLILVTVVVDLGLVINSKTKAKEIAKTTISEHFDQINPELVKTIFEKNKIPTDNLKVIVDSNKITIQNNYEISSIFGSIIGIKHYKIKINITGIKENEKLKFV